MKKIIYFILILSIYLNGSQDPYPFDKTKLQNYHKGINLDDYLGIVTNQVWVYSKKLNKKQLKNKILSIYNFKLIGYNKYYGWLVEYDNLNTADLDMIQKLKKSLFINNIFHRVYNGKNGFKLMN